MHPVRSTLHLLTALLLMLAVAPAFAEDAAATPAAPPEAAWQQVISSQIEAFRKGDAPEAFAYAGASFQQRFPNAVIFFEAIVASGYAPIMTSKSHSFGPFERTGQNGVMQVVKFVGANQELYEAIYQLMEEPTGWRVQGVMLGKPAGIGI